MRPIFLFLVLAGVGIIAWLILSRPAQKQPETRQAALSVSKHSEDFNNAVGNMLDQYNQISENLVAWDSAAAAANAAKLAEGLNSLPLENLKKDQGIYETALMFVENAKGEVQTIATENNIRPQREAFHSLTDNFYQFLNVVQYDREVLYLQECPMAFDDTKTAQWLSKKEEIRNPYLGLYHPTYGRGMLKCGETKTKLNHTGTE